MHEEPEYFLVLSIPSFRRPAASKLLVHIVGITEELFHRDFLFFFQTVINARRGKYIVNYKMGHFYIEDHVRTRLLDFGEIGK